MPQWTDEQLSPFAKPESSLKTTNALTNISPEKASPVTTLCTELVLPILVHASASFDDLMNLATSNGRFFVVYLANKKRLLRRSIRRKWRSKHERRWYMTISLILRKHWRQPLHELGLSRFLSGLTAYEQFTAADVRRAALIEKGLRRIKDRGDQWCDTHTVVFWILTSLCARSLEETVFVPKREELKRALHEFLNLKKKYRYDFMSECVREQQLHLTVHGNATAELLEMMQREAETLYPEVPYMYLDFCKYMPAAIRFCFLQDKKSQRLLHKAIRDAKESELGLLEELVELQGEEKWFTALGEEKLRVLQQNLDDLYLDGLELIFGRDC